MHSRGSQIATGNRRFIVELKMDDSWIDDNVVDIHRDSGELNLNGWRLFFSL